MCYRSSQTSPTLCMNECRSVRIHKLNLLSAARALASAESTTSSECTVTQSLEKKKPPNALKLGKGRSKDSFQELLTTVRNKPHSAPANQVLDTKEHGMLLVHHTWLLLIAAKRKILGMIHGAATAGLLPELSWCVWILELRRPPPPSSSPLTTPEKPTARRYQQKAAQAAVDSRQQTIQGHSGTTITNPTVPEIEQRGAPPHRTTTTPNPPSLPEKSTQRTTAPCAALPAIWQNPTATVETRRAHQGSAAASDKD